MFKRFPFYKQLDLRDCGAVCLKIIAKHYGKYLDLPFLKERCGTSREGVSIFDICTAADSIGLKSAASKVDFATLAKKAPLPCIVHWQEKHFLVVYKVGKNKVYLSDPARGLVTESWSDFQSNWKGDDELGKIILFEPTPKFKEIEEAKTNALQGIRYLLAYLKPFKKYALQLLLVLVVITLIQAVLPIISQAVIDVGITGQDFDFIYLMLLANLILITCTSAGNWVRASLSLHISSRIKISLLTDYLYKLLRLPINYFENKLIGDIIQRARDHERIQSFIMGSLFNVVLACLSLIVFGIILFLYATTLFWIFTGGSVAYILWVLIFWTWRKKLDIKYFEYKAEDHSQWIETLSNVQEIKLNSFEKGKRWKWESVQSKLYKINVQILKMDQGQQLGSDFINAVKNVGLTFYSAVSVVNGDMTLGMLIAVQFIISQLNGPINDVVHFITSSQMAYISFMRLSEVNQVPDEENSSNANNMYFPDEGSLTVQNVSFKYSANDPLVLKNLSFVIPEAKVTAIVGPSGSGKSTLIKLLLRLYQTLPGGEIYIGSSNAKNVSLKLWRKKCGAVLQESEIFQDTIINNVALDIETTDYEKFAEVMDLVNLKKEVELLPLGFHTMMGENGRGLSSGQKQRIIIARALYKNPDYLFLDEPTSSLDSQNEKKIIGNLKENSQGKTMIIAAHRLSTIKDADQIIVLNQGVIAGIGNHEELMKKNKTYMSLFRNQLNLAKTPQHVG
ncbi:MAG: peptidase domain-containing ABC transporter [Cyclobacteriaceae bacterium]